MHSCSDGWKILFGIMWLNSPPDERVSARSFTAGLAARMRLVAWVVHLLQVAHTKERLPGIFAGHGWLVSIAHERRLGRRGQLISPSVWCLRAFGMHARARPGMHADCASHAVCNSLFYRALSPRAARVFALCVCS